MNDMRAVIIPKSDQMIADDLIGGPITITISDVSIRPGTEQPVSIHFEGDRGKPFKPCKSMCRVMVNIWGPDAKAYIGKSMSLYRDPKVKWGGLEVGGIRVSHMSDIDSDVVMALTETRASKKPFTVRPLRAEKSTQPKQTPDQWADGFLAKLAEMPTVVDVDAHEGKYPNRLAAMRKDDPDIAKRVDDAIKAKRAEFVVTVEDDF